MVRNISALNLLGVQNVQGIHVANVRANAFADKVSNVAGPKTQQLNMNEMAGAIQKTQNEEKEKGLTFSEILNLFKSGKLDPRKMGEIVIKSGNDEYRIYVGKDPKYGDQNLIIFENKKIEKSEHKKSETAFRAVFTFADYDRMVEATRKQQPVA